MTNTTLKVDSLTKIFPHPSKENVNISLFANTSFEMNPKRINFLIGPSGSGKTTLIRIIMAVEAFEAGEIFVNRTKINDLYGKTKQQYLSNIGYMDQFPSKYLFMEETASYNLQYTLKLYKKSMKREERKKLIATIATELDFADKLNQKLAVLSGGELRRVSFACAFISEPVILLCDEPTAHLDEQTKNNLMDAIVRLSDLHETLVIIATHDYSLLKKGNVYEIANRRINRVHS